MLALRPAHSALHRRKCASSHSFGIIAPRFRISAGYAENASSVLSEKVGVVYEGIVFDMDGTLTEAHIDFADMRHRTRIPQGDLFTVLEASTPEHIQHAMAVILEIEAEAAKQVSPKPGLIDLLTFLRDKKIRMALVTRNTSASVNAFLDLIGPEWAELFNPVLTREFSYVKPDKRLLQHVAKEWKVDPSSLLMVGDSFEDVEVGNAAGTATCLVAGGGNEKPGVVVETPAGALATMTVSGLPHLMEMLKEGTSLRFGWAAREADGEIIGAEGAPAPGLDFLDWCSQHGALSCGGASYPRMGRYAGGLATSDILGSRVLHVSCGTGGLTKMMCSQGMDVLGTDVDVSAAERRGLAVVPTLSTNGKIVTGSLKPAQEKGPFEAVIILDCTTETNSALSRWWTSESLQELLSVLGDQKGKLCAEVMLDSTVNPASILNSLHDCGLSVTAWHIVQLGQGRKGRALRLVAQQVAGTLSNQN